MTTMERRPDSRGKVRDIYDAGENLLMVATDRISAFDFILPDEIPFKGEVLNRISAFWFDKFADIVPNHLVRTGYRYCKGCRYASRSGGFSRGVCRVS